MYRKRCVSLIAALPVPATVLAQDAVNRKAVRRIDDPVKANTDSQDGRFRSFPHFTSSFTYQGQVYPFTMVGYAPSSGRTATVRTVIIPLRMNFVFFEQDHDATFRNGVGQSGDQLQRATFWNTMDSRRQWHVRLARPRVLDPIDVRVEPDIGEPLQLGSTSTRSSRSATRRVMGRGSFCSPPSSFRSTALTTTRRTS